MTDTASIVVGIVSCIISALAVFFGMRGVARREREAAAEHVRVLQAAQKLAASGDDTRRKIEVVTEVAREREATIHVEAAKEVQRDPVERANEIIRAARADSGGDGGAAPDAAVSAPLRRMP